MRAGVGRGYSKLYMVVFSVCMGDAYIDKSSDTS